MSDSGEGVRVLLVLALTAMSALLVVACADRLHSAQMQSHIPKTPWEALLERAKRDAAEGRATSVIMRSGGVYTFYNNPKPFCYTYWIPGEWYPTGTARYRSKDGLAVVAVSLWPPSELETMKGATLLERARERAAQEYKSVIGEYSVNVDWRPFETERPGAWRWKSAPLVAAAGSFPSVTTILVDLGPTAILFVSIGGTRDDNDLAKRIIQSVRIASDGKCYFWLLDELRDAGAVSDDGREPYIGHY